jgi:hypothetical protein
MGVVGERNGLPRCMDDLGALPNVLAPHITPNSGGTIGVLPLSLVM